MADNICTKRAGRATLAGAGAVLLWAFLALLTTKAGPVPPFLLTTMTFTVAFVIYLMIWRWRGTNALALLRQPAPVWLLGVGGLFGYHFFYFLALGNAPAVEASLIAYLWPLLIIMFAALLPGERLRGYQMVGALMGFAGAAVIILGAGGGSVDSGGAGNANISISLAPGHFAAMLCALIWSGYSVLSRRLRAVPSDMVGWFCGATAVLSFAAHLMFEEVRWPQGTTAWLAVAGLGLGPVGIAFFLWDVGVKHGHIQPLAAISYMAPLLSTVVLILFGEAEASWRIALACLLITAGALVVSWRLLRPQSSA